MTGAPNGHERRGRWAIVVGAFTLMILAVLGWFYFTPP